MAGDETLKKNIQPDYQMDPVFELVEEQVSTHNNDNRCQC